MTSWRQASRPLDVPFFSCRGYTSQSEMWNAAQRFIREDSEGKDCFIVHLGDHDPSGIDMTRDIQERLEMFGASVEVRRVALTMEQIRRFDPPPNPAKLSDSRCGQYVRRYGYSSWELDALEPQVLCDLITAEVEELCDMELFAKAEKEESMQRQTIRRISDSYERVSAFLERGC